MTGSGTRKKLTKSHRYLLFDLGVRRVSAGEGTRLSRGTVGSIFDEFVGLELLRCARLSTRQATLRFWRDPDGREVDRVIESPRSLVPVEVKLTDTPTPRDIKHLRVFLREYRSARHGYVVCTAPRRLKLAANVTAVPRQEIDSLLPDGARRQAWGSGGGGRVTRAIEHDP